MQKPPVESPLQLFEDRKRDHIRWALDSSTQTGGSGFERVVLQHEALPELDFSEVSLAADALGIPLRTPFLISSMTAGHEQAVELNHRLARAAAKCGWAMGVGSQRRELTDANAADEWRGLRAELPHAVLFGNLGLAQLIETNTEQVQQLVENLQAQALIVHLNALQECIQPEGTPQFRGGLQALNRVCKELKVPVVVKETGCGISAETAKRLYAAGVAAVDVSGFGGTHWGRVEGMRAGSQSSEYAAARTFADWGIPTAESLHATLSQAKDTQEVWASGGIRTGLDAAKALAMGANLVGFAQPLMQAAVLSEEVLLTRMQQIEFELKVALFCTGSRDVKSLREKRVWKWHQAHRP